MRTLCVSLLTAAFALVLALPAAAQAEQRLALVVGVSQYGPHSLANPVNDARRLKTALENADFGTTMLLDPTRGQFREAVNALAAAAAAKGRDTTIAFYFAGHALQFDGQNWLIPAQTDIFEGAPSVANVEDGAVSARWVLARLSETGAGRLLIVLDACRTNPFSDRQSVVEGNGLAKMTAVPGGPDTMIVFAAEVGAQAFDGASGNSPFSQAFAQMIAVPGIEIAEAFTAVRERVRIDTAGRQRPYIEGVFSFQFKPGAPTDAIVTQTGIASARIQSAEDGWDLLHETMRARTIDELRTSAAGSDGVAMYLLGLAHWDGLYGADKNPAEAQRLMRRAAARGIGRAANSLGYFACCSDDMPKDPAEAVEWFRIGMELGSVGAINNLAVQTRDGEGVTKDRREAERLFNVAAERGYPLALRNLAILYDGAKYGTDDPQRALGYYQRAYDAGYREAASDVSRAHRYGSYGVAKNPRQALAVLERGAEAGCRRCWFEAGGLVGGDELGAADPVRAYQLYRRGADAGDAEAMVETARALAKGRGVGEDDAQAFRFYERAAAAGNAEAKGSMGAALAKGEGVARDVERAATLLREVLALETDPNLTRRHSVYEPNYWGYGRTLAELHETRAIRGASAEEAARLRARYGGRPQDGGMKRFTVPIDCAGIKSPFHVYIVNWDRPGDEVLEGQVAWLINSRGCTFPADVLESFRKLKKISRENNVSFIDLAVYALGSADPGPVSANVAGAAVAAGVTPTATVAAPPPQNTWTREADATPLTATGAVLNETATVLLYGRDPRGRPVHTYVKLTLAKLVDLRRKVAASEAFDPRTFGEVLASGFGEPEADVKQRMSRERTVAAAQSRR